MKTNLLKFTVLLLLLLGGFAALVAPIDQYHYTQEGFYAAQQQAMALYRHTTDSSQQPFKAGWATKSITPDFYTPMAGYRLRNPYEGIHDSIQAQAVAFQKGQTKAFILNLDLLIFPPALKQALADTLPSLGWNIEQVYLSATHTHSSIGGWIPTFGGRFIAGEYSPKVMNWLLKQSVRALQDAEQQVRPVRFAPWHTEAPAYIRNRLTQEGSIDASLQGFTLTDSAGSTLIVGSYASHPTCLSSKDRYLSADYPGAYRKAVKELSSTPNTSALFLAGPMGSHSPLHPNDSLRNLAKAQAIGKDLALATLQALPADSLLNAMPRLGISQLPLHVDTLQARISGRLGTRPWLFRQVLEETPLRISHLQLGNIHLIGTPCDFSGELALELYTSFQKQGKQLLISSFNGGYVGYVTPDKYYHRIKKAETREMNWTGPSTGEYMVEVIRTIGEK